MSVSVNALQSHINVINGLSDPFESLQMNIEMNLRSDLVRCYGFSVEFVSGLSEDEVYHFIDCIEDGIDPLEKMVQLQNAEEIKEQIQSELETNLKVEEMGFSERTLKVLEKHSIKTEQQLRRLELLDLMKMRDMGKKSILEIEEKLNIRYDW